MTLTKEQQDKLEKLEADIRNLGSLAVGFSGGVDSTFLLAVSHKVLGDKAIAVTAADASVPEREMNEAKDFCAARGIRHYICTVDPLEIEGYRNNTPDRCYFCKHAIFSEILRTAKENGIEHVAEASNTDDLFDYRPGLQAVAELGVVSPLRDAGFNKADIRAISKTMGLPTWDKPAYACLASRFVYGEKITKEKLHMIDEAEQFLIDNGFTGVRVRMHKDIARIEVREEDIPRIAAEDMRTAVTTRFKQIGFTYVTLDLAGYKRGSMNAPLGL